MLGIELSTAQTSAVEIGDVRSLGGSRFEVNER